MVSIHGLLGSLALRRAYEPNAIPLRYPAIVLETPIQNQNSSRPATPSLTHLGS